MKIERCSPRPPPNVRQLTWDEIKSKPGRVYRIVNKEHLRLIVCDYGHAVFVNCETEFYVAQDRQFADDLFEYLPNAKLCVEVRE